VQGTQVSLFDVADPERPSRLAALGLGASGSSEAEWDPHAFLYWPATGLIVVPMQKYATDDGQWSAGVQLIRVSGGTMTKIGFLSHPTSPLSSMNVIPIRRSLVIGDELWTVSDAGLLASDLSSGRQLAWLPGQMVYPVK
jgi:hypothetical protein